MALDRMCLLIETPMRPSAMFLKDGKRKSAADGTVLSSLIGDSVTRLCVPPLRNGVPISVQQICHLGYRNTPLGMCLAALSYDT